MARLHTEGGIVISNNQMSEEFKEHIEFPKQFTIGINETFYYSEDDIPEKCIEAINMAIYEAREKAGNDSILILCSLKPLALRTSYIATPANTRMLGDLGYPILHKQEIIVFIYKDKNSLINAANFRKEYDAKWQENFN